MIFYSGELWGELIISCYAKHFALTFVLGSTIYLHHACSSAANVVLL